MNYIELQESLFDPLQKKSYQQAEVAESRNSRSVA